MPMDKKGQTIFIVDDSPEDRNVLRRHLLRDSEINYTIFEEETGQSSLELCKATKPDCILLDFNLPDMNGLDFLTELSDSESGSVPFPVVILTGISDESVAIQAMKSGAQDYLVKGNITTESLHRAIQNAIERVEMLHALEEHQRNLEQKNQELQAFAYALAHDLRAPLRAITGFAQIVHQEYQAVLDAEGHHFMENIIRACAQMDRLIEDLLSYTRIENKTARRQPIALAPMLTQIIESFSERIAQSGATIDIAPDLPIIHADRTLIGQIFINLIDNALTYHRTGVPPHITINCTVANQAALISVADNGIGIEVRHHDKIFHIFQRLHSYEEYSGTGIGLAVVKKAVELMGGQVWVESMVGQGSTFWVKLPQEI